MHFPDTDGGRYTRSASRHSIPSSGVQELGSVITHNKSVYSRLRGEISALQNQNATRQSGGENLFVTEFAVKSPRNQGETGRCRGNVLAENP